MGLRCLFFLAWLVRIRSCRYGDRTAPWVISFEKRWRADWLPNCFSCQNVKIKVFSREDCKNNFVPSHVQIGSLLDGWLIISSIQLRHENKWPAQDSNLESPAPEADALSIRPTGQLVCPKVTHGSSWHTQLHFCAIVTSSTCTKQLTPIASLVPPGVRPGSGRLVES